MSKPDIKRMLALYFGTSITGDEIPDVEGETYFDKEDFEDENKQKRKKEYTPVQQQHIITKGCSV